MFPCRPFGSLATIGGQYIPPFSGDSTHAEWKLRCHDGAVPLLKFAFTDDAENRAGLYQAGSVFFYLKN